MSGQDWLQTLMVRLQQDRLAALEGALSEVARKSTAVESDGRPMAGQLWTIKQAATFLRVSEKTLHRWVRSGTMPCVRVGYGLRFDGADVLRWVSARKES